MKKILLILLSAILLVGCQTKVTETAEETTETTTEETTNGSGIKYFGVGQAISIESSKSKSDDGNASGNIDAEIVAVGFDADYKIVSIDYDVLSTGLELDEELNLPEGYADAKYLTKTELKDDYGMIVASGIKKEWYEQAEALEAFVIGKTVEEVTTAIADKDADLLSGATFTLFGFEAALANAKENAVETSEATKVGLGILTNASGSKADENGTTVAFEITIVGVATDDNGVIKANSIDMVPAQISFDADGQLTNTDMVVKTKLELKDDYGMKVASPIQKEWYEQSIALSEYVNGKTLEEILAIKTSDQGLLQEEDLATSATFTVGTILPTFEKAVKAAK